MTAAYEEPMARVSISRILEKVTSMESTLAVVSCDVKALREELGDVEGRTRSLESDRFPWKVIGGIVGLATFALAVIIFLVSQNDGRPPPPPKPNSMGEQWTS